MAIDDELKAQILRYQFVEHWPVGTIASQLGVHHSTVERVLGEAGVERERQRPRRPSKLDSYRASSRSERHFRGVHHRDVGALPHAERRSAVRHGQGARLHRRSRPFPSPHRADAPTPPARGVSATAHPSGRAGTGRLGALRKAHHRTRRTPPDGIRPGAELLPIPLRALLPRRLARQPHPRPRRGVLRAGGHGEGPALRQYENVVLERRGDAIRFYPTLLELAAHYRFEPRPVAPARGNEKSHASYCAPFATSGVDSP